MRLSTSLNRLLETKKARLSFQVSTVGDLNAVRGFVGMLGIKRKHVVLGGVPRRLRAAVREKLSGYHLMSSARRSSERPFVIRFDLCGKIRVRDGKLLMNLDPYKYCLAASRVEQERKQIRRAMGVSNGRKIIVVLSPSRLEIKEVLKAHRRIEPCYRPLLIFGLTDEIFSSNGFFEQTGLKILRRLKRTRSLASFGRSDIVFVYTMGELFNFLKAADLAIVGHDRNLFEPAFLNVPILYFDIPSNIDEKKRKIAELFEIDWRNNRTAKQLLDETGGAVKIRAPKLASQINILLKNPAAVIRGAQEAVEKFKREVVPASRLHSSLLLAAVLTRRLSK